jgi:hypothetical protein
MEVGDDMWYCNKCKKVAKTLFSRVRSTIVEGNGCISTRQTRGIDTNTITTYVLDCGCALSGEKGSILKYYVLLNEIKVSDFKYDYDIRKVCRVRWLSSLTREEYDNIRIQVDKIVKDLRAKKTLGKMG